MRRLACLVLALAALPACGDKSQESPKPGPDKAPTPKAAAADAATAVPPAPADAAPAAPAEPDPVGEHDAAGKLLFRVAACGSDEPLPANLPAAAIDAHCAALDKVLAEYREKWLDKALAFLPTIVPQGLPDKVIYPFGGSDLITALATYPDAREITIISLEESGDIRTVAKLKNDELVDSLKSNRDHLQFLLRSAFHRTEDLKEMTATGIPSELFDDMVALRAHGRVPVSVRYFTIKEDGSLDYAPRKLVNVEITFRKAGGGPLTVYRHLAQDLSNGGLKKAPGVVAYIKARAPFVGIIKASSFLLWKDWFATIRNLMLEGGVFIVSDATLPVPKVMEKAGWEMTTYGDFGGAEVAFEGLDATVMVDLWASQPRRELPIRYGYSDVKRKAHLVTSKKKASP